MSEFQVALLIGAVITALISFRTPRAVIWIGAGAASFVFSTAYARVGWGYPPAFTAVLDASICFAIYFSAKTRWEMYLFLLFQGSVLVSTMYLAGIIGPHWAYIAFLEGINWLALGVIGGTSALSWIGNAGRDHHWFVRHLRGADRALHAEIHKPFRGR